jgi:hypothetical protein
MATVAHRGSHDKISACDWLDTLHRGSKWQEVTIFNRVDFRLRMREKRKRGVHVSAG